MFKQLFFSLVTLGDSPDTYQHSMVYSLLSVVLYSLRNLYNAEATIHTPLGVAISNTIESILEYINQHLTEDFTLDDLCKQFGISKSYLNKRFKEIYGTTLWNYVLSKRLAVARQHIHNGMTIQETCRQSGFNDYSNFYRSYLKRFGCSPKEDTFSPVHHTII